MNGAPPGRGAVIRYSYLWAEEHRSGREEGRKDRPALVLALSTRTERDELELLVLAITHSAPAEPSAAVEVLADLKRSLGLGDSRSWIVTTEANAFVWPGPDIRPVPGRTPRTVIYGYVPERLLRDVAASFLANRRRQLAGVTVRSE